MKRMIRLFFVTVAMVVMAAFCQAAGPPVLLTHTLTGYNEGASPPTADYSLHVETPGNTPLAGLTLSIVTIHSSRHRQPLTWKISLLMRKGMPSCS